MSRSITFLAGALTLVSFAVARPTKAATALRFDSGPTVLSRGNNNLTNANPGLGTMVFGYHLDLDGKKKLGGYWWEGSSDSRGPVWAGRLVSNPVAELGYDGDPGATHLNDNSHDIITCGHSTEPPGHMFCARVENRHGEWFSEQPVQVAGGTFNAGRSPALASVRGINTVSTFIFARGQDNQIWYAYRDQLSHTNPGDAYHGWWQMPLPGVDWFTSDPAVTTYTADDMLIVCARLSSSSRYACNKQVGGNGGSRVWSGWSQALGGTVSGWHPVLARTPSTVYLLGIDTSGQEFMTTFPFGGGSWSPFTWIGFGGAASGLGATGTSVAGSNRALVAERRSDSTVWYKTGSSSGWESRWVQFRYDISTTGP